MLHAQSPFRSNQFQECSNLPSTEVLNPTCSSTFTGTNFLCANSPSHNRSCLHCSLFAISTFNACSSSLIPNRASSCSQSLGSHTIGSNALGLHASIQGVRRFGLGISHRQCNRNRDHNRHSKPAHKPPIPSLLHSRFEVDPHRVVIP